MSTDGRAQADLPEQARKLRDQDGVGAAGTFSPRAVGTQRSKLIDHGKLIRRSDGSFGTTIRTLITNAVAVSLKSKRLAIAGFNREIVPTNKGRQVDMEEQDARAAAQANHSVQQDP